MAEQPAAGATRLTKEQIVSSAAFQAGVQKRAALVGASTPRSSWVPEEEKPFRFDVVSWDLYEARARDTGQIVGHDWMVLFRISDANSPDFEKTFSRYYRIREASKATTKMSVPASRLRQLLETVMEGAEAPDEAQWPALLTGIVNEKLQFRGKIVTSRSMLLAKPGMPAKPWVEQYVDVIDEYDPNKAVPDAEQIAAPATGAEGPDLPYNEPPAGGNGTPAPVAAAVPQG